MPVADTLPGVAILPPSLETLLGALRQVTARQVIIRGFGSPCADNDHVFRDWITGIYRSPVPVKGVFLFEVTARHLLLQICELCETVRVRDHTVSTARTRAGTIIRDSPDIQLGWYTGTRRNRRTYS